MRCLKITENCIACGLPIESPEQLLNTEQNLCIFCTANGSHDPNFEVIVLSMAMGYFKKVENVDSIIVAIRQAYETVLKFPYWINRASDIPSIEDMKKTQCIISLFEQMKNVEEGKFAVEPPDFFISYNWSGPDIVDSLVASLINHGYKVWYDKQTWGTEAGRTEDWMKRGVENARHIAIVLSSPYLKSKNCGIELKETLTQKDTKHIFPIWSEDITSDLIKEHELGEQILNVERTNWSDFNGEVEILTNLLIKKGNEADGLSNYNGISLFANEVRILESLEENLGLAIPHIEIIDGDSLPSFGFSSKNNHIIGIFLANKGMTTLPNSFGQLTFLEAVNLENNGLSELPGSFKFLKALKRLNLSRNNISELISELNFSHLEELHIDNNPLKEFPPWINVIRKNKGKFVDLREEEADFLFGMELLIGKDLTHETSIIITRKDFSYRTENNSVSVLNIGEQGLKYLQESITSLSNVRELYLRGNLLKTLPTSIGTLSKLEKLILENNQLSSLPVTIGDLTNLKELDFYDNKLNSIPDSIGNLNSLERLNLQWNNIESLPESIGNLNSLKMLLLASGVKGKENFIKTLPESIGNLKSLKHLYLKGNLLETLPESFGGLENLKSLDLMSNKLISLPNSIGNLKKMEKLTTTLNKLVTFPDSIGTCESLIELEASANEISSLPASIGQLVNLKKLILDENKLEIIPEGITNLQSIKELSLRNNNLTSLPESIGNLKTLCKFELGSNKLDKIPESIGDLSDLEELNMSQNPISLLPESIGSLHKLSKIALSNWPSMPLKKLPESISSMASLKSIDINNAEIESIPASICSIPNLEVLILAQMPLKKLPDCIGNIPNLKHLNVYSTYIGSVPDSIWSSETLEMLNIADIGYTSIPEEVLQLKSLSMLEIDKKMSKQSLSIVEKLKVQGVYVNDYYESTKEWRPQQ